MTTLPTKIKIEFLKKGVTGAEIARRMGVTRQAIYHHIEGRRKGKRLRKAICDATGLPMSIWEERDKAV
jgi:predicted transcriptional regulator